MLLYICIADKLFFYGYDYAGITEGNGDGKMTQEELAKKTSLSIASIQGYEQKKYKPKLNTIANMIWQKNQKRQKKLNTP